MDKEPQKFASVQKYCTRCGSFNTKFKYLNNGKATQPRYKCQDCKNYFQGINHNRKTPMKYLKPKHQDPHELQGLFKVCHFCGAKNKATFKFYNNKSKCGLTQPCFQCLNCRKHFQMYFEGGQLLPSKGKRAPQSPQASTSICEEDVGYKQQVKSSITANDETLNEDNYMRAKQTLNDDREYFYTNEMQVLDTTPISPHGEYYTKEIEAAETNDLCMWAPGYDGTQDAPWSFNQSLDANLAGLVQES